MRRTFSRRAAKPFTVVVSIVCIRLLVSGGVIRYQQGPKMLEKAEEKKHGRAEVKTMTLRCWQ